MVEPVAFVLSDRRPFPGLRPFDFSHHDFFFGREKQIYALYNLLHDNPFVAVVGSSGSGKSSLVRAGLLPVLDGIKEADGGATWIREELRPGDAPIERLIQALVRVARRCAANDEPDALAAREARIEYLIRRSAGGIAESLGEIPGYGNRRLLILVDQFEELFRYARSDAVSRSRDPREVARSREEAEDFVRLLLEAGNNPTFDVCVLITMRSDFIGDCARFDGLPEAVSRTQYLVPSLTRDQCEEAICGPIDKAGATIEPELVERLLNDMGDDSDQLPVLQHCLMRLWEQAGRQAAAPRSDANPGSMSNPDAVHRHLTSDHYAAIGGMTGALSQHANEILRDLPNLEGAVEHVFRALSEVDKDNRATRRPRLLSELTGETAIQADELCRIVDRFRADDCSFLVTSPPGLPLLTTDTRIDVGHEALLRRWTRVNGQPDAGEGDGLGPLSEGWLQREERDGRRYRALLWMVEDKPTGVVTLPLEQVEERCNWWNEWPRTGAWAQRYGGRLDRVRRLLDDSRAALEKERARAQAEQARQRRQGLRDRIAAAVLSALFIFASYLGWMFYNERRAAERSYQLSLLQTSEFVSRTSEYFGRGAVTAAAARDMVASAEKVLTELQKSRQSDSLDFARIRLLLAVSDINATLGNSSEALSKAQSARDIAVMLAERNPKNIDRQLLLYQARFRYADAIFETNTRANLPESLTEYRLARQIAKNLVDASKSDSAQLSARLYDLAFIRTKIGGLLDLQQELELALAEYRDALDAARESAATGPFAVSHAAYVPVVLSRIGRSLGNSGDSRFAESLDYFRQARELQEGLIEKAPGNDVLLSNLATTHSYLADLLLYRRKDCVGARTEYQRSIDIKEVLAEKDPSNSFWLVVLVPNYLSIGDVYRRLGQLDEARARYQKALDGMQKLLNRDPGRTAWENRLKESRTRLEGLEAPLKPNEQCVPP
jgi:tetratricopeptide (TPR) repeat protein